MTERASRTLFEHRGFTIVELLIVVVVIAILASITLVTYNGVRRMATESALKSELSSTTKGFEVEQVSTGTSTYNPQGSEYLYRETSNSILQYSYGNSQSYCMTARSKSDNSIVYHVATESGASIQEGECPAPDFSTTYRCVVGKVTSVATFKNTTSEAISLQANHGATGDQQTVGIDPGKTVSQSYSLRVTSVARGVIRFSVYSTSGALLETYYQASPAITCS